MGEKFDFSGWATKNDLKCSDGRTIRRDAFKDNDGCTVPLVWQHQHGYPENVLGHALLENRDNGVYAYCSCNNTPEGVRAKALVEHGDITSLSIYANQLRQNGGDVIHGTIRELSLVLAGANPGAVIDYPALEHSDDPADTEFTGTICYNEPIDLQHADESGDNKEAEMAEEKKPEEGKEKTVKDVFDSFTDEQKKVVYFMIGQALEGKGEEAEDVEHSDEEEDVMKHNVFDGEQQQNEEVLSHDAMMTMINDGKRYGSLKESVLQHSAEYGIENIEYLFPDAKSLNTPPDFIKRETGWVKTFMSKTHHTPFSRIKSMFANITADEARARGYVKGNMKIEEVFPLLKRTTTPCTIYKKQKLDRDDIVDITDFDVVAWLKTEMRGMLDEEIARAALIGDGRVAGTDDKIPEDNIRPIWTDNELYTIQQNVTVASSATDEQKAKAFIKQAIKARKNYKGSGNPILFTTEDMLTDMLLIEDTTGRVIYDSEEKLARALRVSQIVTVEVMENKTRTVNSVTHTLAGIIVNPVDYNFGADKGGSINMFDDFDIDYNQQKYLIETRCSGALVKPYSAISLEFVTA